MPKIIKNLEEKIFNAALKLFGDYGYDEVDMKKIAKEVGISVGTLYNYYSNKEELFINVFNKSWEATLYKLDNAMASYTDPMEKIKRYIEVLYDEITLRKGLGRELIMKAEVFQHMNGDILESLRAKIIAQIDGYIEDLSIEIEEGDKQRFSEIIVLSIFGLLNSYKNEKEENIKFICGLIHAYIN